MVEALYVLGLVLPIGAALWGAEEMRRLASLPEGEEPEEDSTPELVDEIVESVEIGRRRRFSRSLRRQLEQKPTDAVGPAPVIAPPKREFEYSESGRVERVTLPSGRRLVRETYTLDWRDAETLKVAVAWDHATDSLYRTIESSIEREKLRKRLGPT